MTAIGRPVRQHRVLADAPTVVRDSTGNALELDSLPLGSGGQGAVYRISNSRYAAKLVHRRLEEPADLGQGLPEKLKRLRWLPLEGLPISRPVELLSPPHTGYTMELLEDMQPITGLCDPPEGEMETWYLAGGGLRRRLRLLARCAGILAVMHGRGLTYGDISPGNILISNAAERHEIWLIDPDNITTESSARHQTVETRLYRAPEVARRHSGNTPFSDMYSFAILAYQTLRGDHPLIGDLAAQSLQLEEAAEHGSLPWTGHSSDSSNRSSCGIPPERVLTSRLTALFQQNFEEGQREPLRRPTGTSWSLALGEAADGVIACSARGCGHTYYARNSPRCPYCATDRPPVLQAVIRTQVPGRYFPGSVKPIIPEEDRGAERRLIIEADTPFTVTTRHSHLTPGAEESPVMRVLWRSDGRLRLQNLGAADIRRVPRNGGLGQAIRPGSEVSGRAHDGWTVHFDREDSIHRLITFHPPMPSEA